MEAPATLTDKAAREFWDRNASTLERAGLLTEADKDAFLVLCLTYSRLNKAIENGAGDIPFVCLAKAFTAQARKFGLTPEDRKRLKVELQKEEKDEFGL